MINCNPVYADVSGNFLDSSSSQNQNISLIRHIGKPANLEELRLEYWRTFPEDKPTEKQLLRLSIHLRDLARYLGSGWPVIIPVYNPQIGEVQYQITDFRKPDGNWNTMTAGQALKLVTKELQILKKSEEKPLIDILIRDQFTNRYQPIIGVPLIRYCYELLNVIKISNSQ